MYDNNQFEVIIIGGSYAGLSAAMTLGRSLRKTLVIDSEKPCNRFTPYAHNFITQDGKKPGEISTLARQQVEKYDTVTFLSDLATQGAKTEHGFEIQTNSGQTFGAQKLLFATGVRDVLPDIDGFTECWGKTVIHCPYCHGYEVKGKKTGIFVNDESVFDFYKIISNWTDSITVFTNGEATFEQAELREHKISIIETPIEHLEHEGGLLKKVVLKNGQTYVLDALYFRPPFVQHCEIPQQLGCAINESGHIEVDGFQKTSLPGVFAAGDCTTPFRSLATASAQGSVAGAMLNHELIRGGVDKTNGHE
ncbi:NAD(P)/FAD-dependent oxidoreductase [Tunicatimonas pelagia]|uniref:NAD(P)/FAD-dependent oxidoreductase n=1 Tax=Tunicatimonas pelagia TaxID=931531 RepID=UPI002666EB57|nr:NAD(P)/FAD-dependent oxidoreductase [Tunicatimonas pelagia]WKN40617.1 NAD(P)/FAD-dependent oxidoreductase [Tunicatimonas pelagia]